MGLSSTQTLRTDITKGKFKSLYYFFGVDDYRISEAVKYVAQQFLPDKQLTTNFRRLDARRTKCADLMAELSVFPMLGERQVFAVADFQSYKPTEIDRVLKLIDPPDSNRIVIFTTPAERAPDKRKAFFKRVSAAAETVEFRRLTSEETQRQIALKLAKVGLEMDPGAAELLVGLLAGNRGALENEIDKLANYKKPGETITPIDIQTVVSGYEALTVYQLAELIAKGETLKALALIKRLLAEGSTPTSLLYFVGQHFVDLYLVKTGHSLEAWRRWLESGLRTQAAQFTEGQLGEAIQLIAHVDAELRWKRTLPELALDQLVLKLMAR
ncbi:MAG: DNA polymerase III subunit delta [Candidatus Zixiibacteriota bacterium]